jgi:hypothetical protein
MLDRHPDTADDSHQVQSARLLTTGHDSTSVFYWVGLGRLTAATTWMTAHGPIHRCIGCGDRSSGSTTSTATGGHTSETTAPTARRPRSRSRSQLHRPAVIEVPEPGDSGKLDEHRP